MKTGLFQPLALAIGLRYAGSRRSNRFVSFISLFSTFGIAIGVAALMVVISVMNGFEGQLKGRILGVIPHVVVTGPGDRLVPPADLAAELATRPHVLAVAPMLATEGMLQSPGQLTGVSVQGIDPARWPAGDLLHQQMQDGALDTLVPGSYRIVLGQGIARTLAVSVGDQVRLILTEGSRYTPLGRVPAQRIFTVSGIFGVGADVDNQIALVNLNDAKRLLRLPADEVGGLRLWLDDAFAVDQVVASPLPDGLNWQDWRRERGELFQAVAMEKRMMGLMLVLIIAVATFNILSALVMVVSDKEGEVAILRTMGMTESAVVRIFMVLGASSGVIGAIVGGLAGLVLTFGLNPLLDAIGLNLYMAAGGGGLPVIVEPLQVVIILLGAVLLSFSATLYPAFRAARVRPAQALRYE
ncbi:lipoprotein-releasing ABC transporter permease subunit [Aeromonas simiae]|uniref:lipoprotein-releasing ABC transporter permease subunit n=1 Tax=Aeromonas simiae TaxID=218936 RepID=UPI0005AB5F2E|nr:lipoprotein-releasing ABC transporter permease subunit [Aeromonas simiae]MDO2947855.1 lipoprotein-releasing ABC transporter permease subunit [Aeromonas simiae]MDO2950972.1 lipoprotein-releasing ABC transporter permease subunit [Aeromonas simiae]MDO2955249.1 lipoprotein-releasing ABC transporter permease subunit [Aeromonas simiae]